jgi:hypothetical protein
VNRLIKGGRFQGSMGLFAPHLETVLRLKISENQLIEVLLETIRDSIRAYFSAI